MGLPLALADHPQVGLQQSQKREAQPSVPPVRGGGCELEPVEPALAELLLLLATPPVAGVPPVGIELPVVPPLGFPPGFPPAPEPQGGLSHLQVP